MIKFRFAIFLALLFSAFGQAQDLHSARKEFSSLEKKPKLAEREPGIQALVATKDVRAMDDLLAALDRVEREIAKVRDKLADAGKKLQETWKDVDSAAGAGRQVSAGSAQNVTKKHDELQAKLLQLEAEQSAFEEWRLMLQKGTGKLLDAVPAPARIEWIAALIVRIDKAPKPEDQLRLLVPVAHSGSREARDAIVGALGRLENEALRIALIDVLAHRSDPATLSALVPCLKDTHWPVRTAAARALAGIPSLDAIPALIETLATSEGRTLEETQMTLEDLCGRTFFDNAPLWREWWAKNQEKLNKTFANAASDDPAAQTGATFTIGEEGLLAAARLMLRQEGLGPKNPDQPSPSESVPAPALDEALSLNRRQAISRAISVCPPAIRERNVDRLLHRPFLHAETNAERIAYVHLLGPIPLPSIRSVLKQLVGPKDLNDRKTKEPIPTKDRDALRLAAIAALGDQGHPEVAESLNDVLSMSGQLPLKTAAIASLRKIRQTVSVKVLISALNDPDASVVALAKEALVDLVGEDQGKDYASWREWWQKSEKTFKPRGHQKPQEETAGGPKKGTSFYGIETRSLHLIYILDRSGSMNETDAGNGKARMQAAKDELTESILSLPDIATFNIIFYNHTFDTWKKTMTQATKENKATAVAWIKSIEAVGATNIFDPIERGFALAGRGTEDKAYGTLLDTVFLMTDGQPNRGRIISPEHILKEVDRMNALKKIKIHTIGVGEGQDEGFLRKLAEMTGGQYVRR